MSLIAGLILLYCLPGYTFACIGFYMGETDDYKIPEKIFFFLFVVVLFPIAFIYQCHKQKSLKQGFDELTRIDNDSYKKISSLKKKLIISEDSKLRYEEQVRELLKENELLRKEDPIAKMKREIEDASK